MKTFVFFVKNFVNFVVRNKKKHKAHKEKNTMNTKKSITEYRNLGNAEKVPFRGFRGERN
jgi:hypothetical protein